MDKLCLGQKIFKSAFGGGFFFNQIRLSGGSFLKTIVMFVEWNNVFVGDCRFSIAVFALFRILIDTDGCTSVIFYEVLYV